MFKTSKPALPSGFYSVISSCLDSHSVACSSALIFGETKQGWRRISLRGDAVGTVMYSQLIEDASAGEFKANGTIQDFQSGITRDGQSIRKQMTILFKQNNNYHEFEPT